MPAKFKDEIISYECVTYPVSVTKWEICKIKDLEKYYVKVYFTKSSDTVKDFYINMNCLSEDGEVISEKTNLPVINADKCGVDFVKIFPLEGRADKVEISIVKCTTCKPNVLKQQIKGLSAYELATYIIAAITLLLYLFVTPFMNDGEVLLLVSCFIEMFLSGGTVGLSLYRIIKKGNNWIIQTVLTIMAVIFIFAIRNVIILFSLF